MKKVTIALLILCITPPIHAMESDTSKQLINQLLHNLWHRKIDDKTATQIVQQVINLKENINNSNFAQQTPLILAAEQGFMDTVQLLIANNANIHAEDSCNETALMKAAKKGHLNIVSFLLNKGAKKYTVKQNAFGDHKPILAVDLTQNALRETSDTQKQKDYEDIISLLSKE